MKLLIIAGPYEADRIRRSAVAAGFETVAVEPGESLSGWITASRPQIIVMAPQMVNPDPALALAKVRSVPRGRVPIFLVGDATDEPRMASLAEGFFVRPVSPEALLAHARQVLATERARESTNLGHELADGGRMPREGTGPFPSPGGTPARPPGGLKPLVMAGMTAPPAEAVSRGARDATALLADLDAGIDSLLDAELARALAAAPKPRAPEAEFTAEPTADLTTRDLRAARRRDEPRARNGAAAPVHGDSPPAPEAVPAPPAEANDGARARILSRYAFVEVGDYFQVLGVARDATAADLQQAHDRLAREIDPAGLDPALAGELGPQIAAIRMVGDEALRILRDDRLRARYSARIAAAG